MILQAILAASSITVALGSICCTPKQWEGFQYAAGGFTRRFRHYGVKDALYRVSYDATNQKVALSGNFTRKHEVRPFKVIYDFTKRRGHFILTEKKSCTSYALKKKFREACIPDNAAFEGSGAFGVGENTLDVKGYKVKTERNGAHVSAVVLVTEECVPVVENVWGSGWKGSFFGSVNFIDLTVGIRDPAVFSPPEYCEAGEVEMIDELQEKFGIMQQ